MNQIQSSGACCPAAPLSPACCNLHLQSEICRLAPALQLPSPPRAAICICNLGSADGPGPWVFCGVRGLFLRISLIKTAKASPLHAAFAACNLQSDRRALQLSSGAQAAICICNLQAADAPALQRTEPTRPLSRRSVNSSKSSKGAAHERTRFRTQRTSVRRGVGCCDAGNAKRCCSR